MIDPDITVEISIVPYGYQLDIGNHISGAGVSICRDFAEDYEEPKIADAMIKAIIKTITNLEREGNLNA